MRVEVLLTSPDMYKPPCHSPLSTYVRTAVQIHSSSQCQCQVRPRSHTHQPILPPWLPLKNPSTPAPPRTRLPIQSCRKNYPGTGGAQIKRPAKARPAAGLCKSIRRDGGRSWQPIKKSQAYIPRGISMSLYDEYRISTCAIGRRARSYGLALFAFGFGNSVGKMLGNSGFGMYSSGLRVNE